ncbi:MAG: hypothetical protein RIE58_07785 [Vicingaceae bacterium]
MKASGIIIILLISVISCKDVIEEDISLKPVLLITPPHLYVSQKSTVSFNWLEVEGAFEYKLQIVKPKFTLVEEIQLDSTIAGNSLSLPLEAGAYQWRVLALNGNYQASSDTSSFTVDSITDVSDISLNLLDPDNNAISNSTILEFEWEGSFLAEDYRFEIRQLDWNGSLEFPAQIVTSATFSNQDYPLQDGQYTWGVRAQAGSSVSPYSTHQLTIDRTAPEKPVLNVPANMAVLANAMQQFSWFRASDQGSKVLDSLYIYQDALLNDLARPIMVLEQPSFSDSLGPGTYYWYVKSFDKAGNISPISSIWNFTISP